MLLVLLYILFGYESLAAPQGDGKIRLFNYHLDEFREITFRQDGKLLDLSLKEINRLFRSRENSETIPINLSLIDLLDHLQDHFEADTIEIISGYRQKEFNEKLRREGHQVSPISLHVKGKAADIHIDEIREETLRDYIMSLKVGGVGYYGPLDTVHVDLGEVRFWGDPGPFPRKLVGVLKKEAPIQLTSDKNDYLAGDTPHFHWTYPEDFDPNSIQDLQLEHFYRGQWTKIGPAPKKVRQSKYVLVFSNSIFTKSDKKPRYGKYRWTFHLKGSPELHSSNEFYLKKF